VYDCASKWGNYLQPPALGPAAFGKAGWGSWSPRCPKARHRGHPSSVVIITFPGTWGTCSTGYAKPHSETQTGVMKCHRRRTPTGRLSRLHNPYHRSSMENNEAPWLSRRSVQARAFIGSYTAFHGAWAPSMRHYCGCLLYALYWERNHGEIQLF
jgi:hypothetical protein